MIFQTVNCVLQNSFTQSGCKEIRVKNLSSWRAIYSFTLFRFRVTFSNQKSELMTKSEINE